MVCLICYEYDIHWEGCYGFHVWSWRKYALIGGLAVVHPSALTAFAWRCFMGSQHEQD